ncbi:HK97 gp10 family phage protein [Jeotgalicoccus sp. S0W5]|uniref:HK97 gp10 family phage protein n=1 Tax=Jeotgalicoccus sp. S0W5 TaxID=2527874 RepID=UPI001414E17F
MARNKLASALKAFSDKTIAQTIKGVETTRDIHYNETRRRIAVDTGETREGITKTAVTRSGSTISAEVFVLGMVPIWLEFGTGIHAVSGGGGSRAKKIPWTYYKDGRFYTTYGMVAQPFWFPSLDITGQYFKNYFSN